MTVMTTICEPKFPSGTITNILLARNYQEEVYWDFSATRSLLRMSLSGQPNMKDSWKHICGLLWDKFVYERGTVRQFGFEYVLSYVAQCVGVGRRFGLCLCLSASITGWERQLLLQFLPLFVFHVLFTLFFLAIANSQWVSKFPQHAEQIHTCTSHIFHFCVTQESGTRLRSA